MNRLSGLQRSVAAAAGSAVAYLLFFKLNDLLFSSLVFARGVSWVFLPSGVRLLLVVVLAGPGAVGISIASVLIALWWLFPGDPLTGVVAGILSGLAPWLARRLSMSLFGMRADLVGLTAGGLLRMAGLFALTSAALHQVWFVARGHSDGYLTGTLVMAIGDFVGALLVLYAARLAQSLVLRLSRQG